MKRKKNLITGLCTNMSLTYINIDITTVPHGIIAHGTNCSHSFGSGVAGAIRKKWPNVYESFMRAPRGPKMLGTAHLIGVSSNGSEDLFVANCYTQLNYGRDGKRYADPNAIQTSLSQVFNWAQLFDLPLYMPKIGCGLGGLDWDTEVQPIVVQLATVHPKVDTYVCEWHPQS